MSSSAKARLDDAIRDHIRTVDPEAIVTDWLLVAATSSGDRTGYLTAANEIPYHTCIGLLDVARQRIDDEAYDED